MNDLFKKLNVLIKSSVGSAVQGEEHPARPQVRLGKNVDVEVESLRERINDAVRYEDDLKARAQQFEAEAARWDRQADDAVARGDEASARYAIEQMRRAEQRATMAQVDLQAHQVATEDLIQRVNMLDAVVADARRAQEAEKPADAPSASQVPQNLHLPDLGNVLRETRERIASLGELAAAQRDVNPAELSPDQNDEAAIDDDLEDRRQRLSKR